jgi:lactoylglutathione lyase
MKQVNKLEFPELSFTLYFMGYSGSCGDKNWTNCEGLVELTHNHGTENDPNFQVASGNADPGKGFGHLCVTVDNTQAACERLEKEGYLFQKKLTDGRMRHIAFVKDPDGYVPSERRVEAVADQHLDTGWRS